MIFCRESLSKLAELKNAKEWALWLKAEFEAADGAARAAVEEEVKRSRELPPRGTKDKWKIKLRVLTASHSIRPKTLTGWNKQVDGIKLRTATKNDRHDRTRK